MRSLAYYWQLRETSRHQDIRSRDFMTACRRKSQSRQEDRPEIGTTGYPTYSQTKLNDGSYCFDQPEWTTDKLGRFYLFTGLRQLPLLFQRYTEGDVLVAYQPRRGWHPLDEEDWNLLRQSLLD